MARMLLLLLILLLRKEVMGNYTSEMMLRNTILSGYDNDVRPETTTAVSVTLGLMSLNKLDMTAQTMSLTGFWYVVWKDIRLTWNPNDYSGISQLVVSHKKIWKPPLIINNEVNSIGVIDGAEVPARILYNGDIFWASPITMNTVCEINIQSYPFDSQECSVDLSSWGYAINEIDLLSDPVKPVDYMLYVPQGEWNFISSSVFFLNNSDEINTYRILKFRLKFKRRWLFYSQYLVLPIMLNSVLMISVFTVPLDSGEKLGFSLTVLLSYVVLLTIVADNLPPISTKTSVLQIYLSVVMILGTVATLLSIWILTLYNKEETQRISARLQKFTDYVIAPVVCLSCQNKNKVNEYSSADARPAKIPSAKTIKLEDGREITAASQYNSINDASHERMSYKDFALLLDKFFFRMSATGLFILTSTMILFFIL